MNLQANKTGEMNKKAGAAPGKRCAIARIKRIQANCTPAPFGLVCWCALQENVKTHSAV